MSRGEAADIINKILNGNFKKVEYTANFPVAYKLDNFYGMDWIFRKNLIFFNQIPDKYIEFFNKAGYTYIITNTCEEYFPNYKFLVGMTDSGNKKVYVEKYTNLSTVQHEIGHVIFLEVFGDQNNTLSFIYEKEKQSIVKFVGDYALTNSNEFWAEAFSYLLINKNNVDRIQRFREANPLTTEVVLDNMINYEGLANIEEINKIYEQNVNN